MFLWLKALHLFFVIAWFAGVFYLPRLFVYHAMTEDEATLERFKVMERKLYFFVTPFMILSLALGLWMLVLNWAAYQSALWMHIKLALVAALVAYHLYCGKLLKDFKLDRNRRSHVWYRWFNEIPVLFLLGIVILVIVGPTF